MINRRRAPSSKISKDKKLSGHLREDEYALSIEGTVIKGLQKGDVKDKDGNLHSVKSGKKWQIFLYSYNRINQSSQLKCLQPCLDAFPQDSEQYFKDRVKCIEFKETYLETHGKEKTKELSNDDVKKNLGFNQYIESKHKLKKATNDIYQIFMNKIFIRDFLNEAIFNINEVDFLVIKDTTYKEDELFKVFEKKDVLDILSNNLYPLVSKAGNVPVDFNVSGQKILFYYLRPNQLKKNIIEIEVRNDSDKHYRQIRFNMYSKDALFLLLNNNLIGKKLNNEVIAYSSKH
jgi:hypothetical protein